MGYHIFCAFCQHCHRLRTCTWHMSLNRPPRALFSDMCSEILTAVLSDKNLFPPQRSCRTTCPEPFNWALKGDSNQHSLSQMNAARHCHGNRGVGNPNKQAPFTRNPPPRFRGICAGPFSHPHTFPSLTCFLAQ